MSYIDGMKATRPSKIDAPIRWAAMLVVALFLIALSAAANPSQSQCASEPINTSCASLESACCCQNDSNPPPEPLNALSFLPQPITPTPPLTPAQKLTASERLVEPNLCGERSGDFLLPPELRLGSTLWSHAPPTAPA
jgi:hypothetical protein